MQFKAHQVARPPHGTSRRCHLIRVWSLPDISASCWMWEKKVHNNVEQFAGVTLLPALQSLAGSRTRARTCGFLPFPPCAARCRELAVFFSPPIRFNILSIPHTPTPGVGDVLDPVSPCAGVLCLLWQGLACVEHTKLMTGLYYRQVPYTIDIHIHTADEGFFNHAGLLDKHDTRLSIPIEKDPQ